MKHKLIISFLFILACVTLIPLFLYFYRSSPELSANHTTWGEFGALYGGVLGPFAALLAFIGLLLNLNLTKKQFRNQTENNIFFSLINLHNKKVQLIEFEESGGTKVTGFEAFKRYSEEFTRIYDNDSIRVARKELSTNTKNLTDNAGEFLWNKYANRFHEDSTFWDNRKTNINKMTSLFENNSDPWELQKILVGTDDAISPADREKLISIGHVVIEDSIPKNRIEIIERVYSFFYHDYGHMLGHYFKHIYYILKFIEETEKPLEYSKLLSAQFSRYELTMIYYNLFSEQSNEEFIKLIIKFNLLNELYWPDICYFLNENKILIDINCILDQKSLKQNKT